MAPKRLTGITTIACFVLAIALFGWSLTEKSSSLARQSLVKECTLRLQKKTAEAKSAGEQLCAQKSEVVTRHTISAFCFINNRLQSWTASDVAVSEEQLAAIDTAEQFVRLGNMWYVTHAYMHHNAKIVTAVLIKKSYAYENDFLQPKVSGFLHLPPNVDIAAATGDSSNTVFGTSGKPLFSLVFEEGYIARSNLVSRWLAIALAIIALFLFFHYFATKWAYLVTVFSLILLRAGLFAGKPLFELNSDFFSSSLYADSSFIPTLSDLLLHALFVFFIVLISWKYYRRTQQKNAPGKSISTLLLSLLCLGLMAGIHYVWRSLILNSTIPFDLSRLDQLTAYTFVAYGILVLLFASLAMALYMTIGNTLEKFKKIKPLGWLVIYVIIVSLYTLIALEAYNHHREELRVKAWADKLMVEHDPTAELFLQEISKAISADEELKNRVVHNEPADVIHRYLQQNYFGSYLQYYDLQLTVCQYGTKLHIDTTDTDCFDFFANEIAQYGTRLNDSSLFYYLANDNGRNSYIGQIGYADSTRYEINLFMELDSKLRSGGEGYPELLMDRGAGNRIIMPAGYSYAKYAEGRLISTSGDYKYPYDNDNFFHAGKAFSNGYTHHTFCPDTHHIIVISRYTHTFWSLLILFSYLFFIFGCCIMLLLFATGIVPKINTTHNTFQRKITTLLILSFVISILCVGIATVWYNVRQYKKNAMTQMEDRMRAVLTQLDYYLNNIHGLGQVNDFMIGKELVQLSNSLHIDINLYDTTGRLFISSRIEIFDKQLQSERINRAAFDKLHTARLSDFVHKEQIGRLDFYSFYATYYNTNGKVVAYVNIPYFSKRVEDVREVSAIITTMVNVYILALLIALLIGATLANRLLRPLEIVRRNMQRLDVTKQMEYIYYDEKDELGDLIRAYNQMIAAMEESKQQLAQSERESAWREMARQIAHEIKNPLTPMRLSIQHLMRMKKDNAPDWQQRFDDLAGALLEQIDTLAKTASEFSTFAKASHEEAVSVSLNTLLNELRPLFDTHKNIAIEWLFETSGAEIYGHPAQLSRVLVNLLTNAMQAVQDKPHGQIRITLAKETGAINFPEQANQPHEKTCYCICIEDNGKGVPAEFEEKLFTPNFTTKSSGTGLGLAISKKIIEEMGGRITYKKSGLGGACFRVCLPAKNNEATRN